MNWGCPSLNGRSLEITLKVSARNNRRNFRYHSFIFKKSFNFLPKLRCKNSLDTLRIHSSYVLGKSLKGTVVSWVYNFLMDCKITWHLSNILFNNIIFSHSQSCLDYDHGLCRIIYMYLCISKYVWVNLILIIFNYKILLKIIVCSILSKDKIQEDYRLY